MKIAYLFGTYPRTSETFLQREIDALQQLGFEIEVWALKATPPGHQIEIPPLLRLGKLLYFAKDVYYSGVGRHWSRHQLGKVDHIHSAWAGHPAQIAMTAAREKNIPWSFSGHARDIWVRPRNVAAKLKNAAFATSCTRQGAEFLQSHIPTNPAKVLFAPHGLPLENYPYTPRQTFHSPPRILAVGRLEEKKGFAYLLDALKILQNLDFPVEATLLGTGTFREQLRMQQQELNLSNLQMKGAVPQEEVRVQMQKADLLVAPCIVGKNGDHDGLPNVLLEAAALGLPILTTPVGGTGDLINEETGWLCRPNDAADLAQKIQQIFANPQTAFTKAQSARNAVSAHYDVMDNVKILADAFSQAAM
jgi:glycosyltransferase involved in cell wall biosynthesis